MKKVIFKKDTHQYFDESGREYVSVSRILEYFGISQIQKLIAIHGEEHFDMLRNFGHEVHEMTAAEDRGKHTRKYDKKLEPYLNGWKNWKAMDKPEFLAIEEPLISTTWGFAGTPDRVGKVKRGLAVPDLKSGEITLAEVIQTGFYKILIEENYKKPVVDRFTVHLNPKYPMGFKVNPHRDDNDVTVAKSLLTIFNFKKEKNIL